MRLINDQIERELDSQERSPFNIRNARKALERALVYQFAAIADGILGYLLLHGQPIDELTWRAACLTRFTQKCELNGCSFQTDDTDVASFKKRFLQEIATRRIKAINPRKLNEIEIKVYGKYVGFYDEREINKQLAKLGSAYRLAIPGGRGIVVNEVINQLKLDVVPYAVDSRFILGQVGPLTALPYAQLFDFEREFALSPLIDPGGAGFTYDDRIVIRHSVLTGYVTRRAESSAEHKVVQPRNWVGTLIHESIHIFGSSGQSWFSHVDRRRYPYIEAFWFDDSRGDICRFTEIPSPIDQLRTAFKWNFENFLLKSDDLPDTFVGINLREMMDHFTLEYILDEMKKDRLIIDTPDRCIYSPIYEDGREWCL